MLRYVTSASALTLTLTLAGAAWAHDDLTHFRVFVGDHTAGQITAFDLDHPENRWTFATTGQVKLFPVANGAVVAAVQSDADTVQFLSSGIELHAHGDHADIKVSDPAALDTVLTGPRPFHLVDHDGKVVINYDRGGYAEVLDSAQLAKGQIAPVRFPQARAHHGFVAPLGTSWLSTVASDAPVEGNAAPPRLGLQAFNADGTPAGDLATCTAIHGEAFSGVYLAAGCREGVLAVTAGASGPDYRMLPYPADLPEGVTTGTLLGSTAMQVFLGNHGADGLVVVDPVDEPHFRRIALPFRRVDFVLDPAKPAQGYVLTEDGTLHRVDLLAAELSASASVTAAYSMDGHWNDPRPRLAMAGDELIVTDPAAGLLRRISTADLSEIGTIAVEGIPYNVTVVGGSGVDH
ncbi:zinc transport system substrate-binding protein [Gemmobacter megaterium]|uniref:Zinc transport system substrate-binding protein n=1 Tax=Gemmobacter megaterium TaxID=1086013 RepID=A0A1N7N0Q5_9RHOB|nr:metallochaperone AztD [Gemmobacter megaterium]GGE12206.1 hypothetical protein GCM10011345_17540 [Gemmobacter megaterium]SIS91771.1 zinc transport system substrate-binding protein [Gemmobacter megaterium]